MTGSAGASGAGGATGSGGSGGTSGMGGANGGASGKGGSGGASDGGTSKPDASVDGGKAGSRPDGGSDAGPLGAMPCPTNRFYPPPPDGAEVTCPPHVTDLNAFVPNTAAVVACTPLAHPGSDCPFYFFSWQNFMIASQKLIRGSRTLAIGSVMAYGFGKWSGPRPGPPRRDSMGCNARAARPPARVP